MTWLIKMLYTLTSIILVSNPVLAQKSGFYASAGGGLAGDDSYAFAFNGTFKKGLLSISARYLRTAEIRIEMNLMGGYSPHPPAEAASDVAILAGLTSRSKNSASATFEIGIGYATVVKAVKHYVANPPYEDRLAHDRSTKGTWGLAFQSQLYWRRLGFVITGNLNGSRSFGAGLISFRVGRCN